MRITVPPSKSIVTLSNSSGVVAAFLDSDPEAPPGPRADFAFVRHFLGQCLLADASWGKDMAGVYMAQEIRGAFAAKKPGDVVDLPKAAHDRLLGVMKNPAVGYAAPTMGLALDFLAAIEKAEDT
jgi:hypothetical protein